jgi:hypothetical protein
MLTISDADGPFQKVLLLRDTPLLSESGTIVQASELEPGMLIRGSGEFAEVQNVQWMEKQDHKVLTLYAGLQGVSVFPEQTVTAGTFTEDSAATADWSRLAASTICAGKHELALQSTDGLEEGAAITGVRRFVRATALVQVELRGGFSILVGLQPVMPKTVAVQTAARYQAPTVPARLSGSPPGLRHQGRMQKSAGGVQGNSGACGRR